MPTWNSYRNELDGSTMPNHLCYDVQPNASHWTVSFEGEMGSDIFTSMFAATKAARDAASLRWEKLRQPACVRMKVNIDGPWLVLEEYG